MDDSMKKGLDEIQNNPVSKVVEELNTRTTQVALETMEKFNTFSDSYSYPWLRMPELQIPTLPTAKERNEYQSAGALMRRLADSITQWRQLLPADQQPAILAILNGGIQIDVDRVAEESFHGIRIEGKMRGKPCMVLAHQATIQLLCYVENAEKETSRRRIGFIIDGKEQQI
jgi:hypothetical protein